MSNRLSILGSLPDTRPWRVPARGPSGRPWLWKRPSTSATCSTVLSHVEVDLHHECVTRRLHRGPNRRVRLGQFRTSLRCHHRVVAADRNTSPRQVTLRDDGLLGCAGGGLSARTP